MLQNLFRDKCRYIIPDKCSEYEVDCNYRVPVYGSRLTTDERVKQKSKIIFFPNFLDFQAFYTRGFTSTLCTLGENVMLLRVVQSCFNLQVFID